MKQKLLLTLIFAGGYAFGTFFIVPSFAQESVERMPVSHCPEGSYSIGMEKNGEHICKLEPTGCPYGDSIPMDVCFEKFGPEKEQPKETPNITTKPEATAPEQETITTCTQAK